MSQYDSLAGDYASIIDELPERRLFGYSLETVEGDVAGMDVLDLACGTGVFTRKLQQRGARRVVGVDQSEAMIELARRDEAAHPLGIEYRVADVAEMGRVGEFDLVTAFALLHYSPTEAALFRMLTCIHANLRPGGRFTASNMNVVDPDTWLDTRRWAGYPLQIHPPAGALTEGAALPASMTSKGVTIPLELFYYSRDTYERGLREAGLTGVRWHRPVLPPELDRSADRARWQIYLDHPPILILECRRPR